MFIHGTLLEAAEQPFFERIVIDPAIQKVFMVFSRKKKNANILYKGDFQMEPDVERYEDSAFRALVESIVHRFSKNGRTIAHEKCHFFLGHGASCEQDIQPTFNLYTKTTVLCIYRLMPKRLGLLGYNAAHYDTANNRWFGALCSAIGRRQHCNSPFLVVFDKYGRRLVPCEI